MFLVVVIALMTFSASNVRASGSQLVSLQVSTSTPQPHDAFLFCAVEGVTCTFYGPKAVRYGANNSYIFKVATTSIVCTAAAFGGDPAPGQAKTCGYVGIPVTSFVGWIACATENGICTGYGGDPTVKLVRYGAGNSFVYQRTNYLQNNSIPCTTQAFGTDPAPGLPKQCLFFELPWNSTAWTLCANVGGSCTTSGGSLATIAYGSMANDAFFYKNLASGQSVSCSNAGFSGNPYPYGTSSCYKSPGDWDSNFWVRCANDSGTCTFLGTKTVAYGANGSYYYKDATGSVVCNTATFGVDPAPGQSKRCYYSILGGS